MIFPVLELEKTLQTNDRTRLSGIKSYITVDEAAITLVEIEPHTGDGFIDVTPATATESDLYYLDWQYSTTGTKTVSLRITTDGAPVTTTKTITVVDAATDYLFSQDSQLTALEPDVLKWVRPGRNSFLDVHREVRDKMIDWIDEKGFVKDDGTKVVASDIINVDEVRQWSRYEALILIFEGVSNATDDVFAKKSGRYRALRDQARNRAILRLDLDDSGAVDDDEGLNISTGTMYRR